MWFYFISRHIFITLGGRENISNRYRFREEQLLLCNKTLQTKREGLSSTDIPCHFRVNTYILYHFKKLTTFNEKERYLSKYTIVYLKIGPGKYISIDTSRYKFSPQLMVLLTPPPTHTRTHWALDCRLVVLSTKNGNCLIWSQEILSIDWTIILAWEKSQRFLFSFLLKIWKIYYKML